MMDYHVYVADHPSRGLITLLVSAKALEDEQGDPTAFLPTGCGLPRDYGVVTIDGPGASMVPDYLLDG